MARNCKHTFNVFYFWQIKNGCERCEKLDYHQILSERLSPKEAKISKKFPIYIVLDNVRSVYNVGSFFRTCDSSATQEFILCGYTPYPPREDPQKTILIFQTFQISIVISSTLLENVPFFTILHHWKLPTLCYNNGKPENVPPFSGK